MLGFRAATAARLLFAPFMWLKDRPVVYRGERYTIVGYGVLAALNAAAIVSALSLYLYSRGHLINETTALFLPIVAIGIWLGSRALHILALGRKFFGNPRKYLTETGFYVQGGIVGALVSGAVIAHVAGIETIVVWDGLGWSALLGLFFGRLGCFNYGCCYGRRTTNAQLGVAYQNPETKVLRLRPELRGVHLHPSQLYTSLSHLLAFAGVTALISSRSLPNGTVAGLFLLYHGLSRLLLERFRGDVFFDEGRNWTTFRTAGGMALLGAALLGAGGAVFDGFGVEAPLVHPLAPASYLEMVAANPMIAVGSMVLLIFVFLAFGLHGRKLGTFPWSPENRCARGEVAGAHDSTASPVHQ